VQKLNDRATAELAEVVCAQSVSDKAFKDAVRELLNQEAQQIKD
jgi:major membrane immunogen (membrane-anchored lipoprotein)